MRLLYAANRITLIFAYLFDVSKLMTNLMAVDMIAENCDWYFNIMKLSSTQIYAKCDVFQ